ncbi:tRNA (pseudouridine(54)-N(1))-methyltransferase TrmY [Candidatus Bipolaricaulota bacterium]|nr:tRNA (pseudouridine(54)-N(1))-methyltransferase TrmY [Candidatus Bipolaricaulota bacterium]
MRRFVILGHRAPTTPDFQLNDLPGGAGRLDVLCRAVGASLFLSHGIRRDVETMLLLQDTVRIRISGEHVKRLNPDERSTAALIRHALSSLSSEEVQATPGILISHATLAQTLDSLAEDGATPLVLHEKGKPAESFSFPEHPAFVLSDHLDFTEEDEAALEGLPRISLGPTALHTSQAITIVNYLLDQREEDLHADLVLCHKVWGEPKAQLIKGLLGDFDIPANLMMHAPPGLYPMAVDGLAEVRIMVRPRDCERAQQIIRDYFEEPCAE